MNVYVVRVYYNLQLEMNDGEKREKKFWANCMSMSSFLCVFRRNGTQNVRYMIVYMY